MAWTLDTLLSAVRAYLDPTGDGAFDSQFPTFVRQAEERILHVAKIPAIRRTQSITGVTTELVAEISGFLGPVYLRSNAQVLTLKETSWIAEVYGANSTTGVPMFYALRTKDDYEGDTEVIVAPVPAAATDFTIEYFRKPLSLTEVPQGETTWIGTSAENALLQGVLYYAYQYEKGEADMLAAYLNDFEKAMSLLKGISTTNMLRDEYRASIQASREA